MSARGGSPHGAKGHDMKKICDKCGSEGAVLAPHQGKVLCDRCFIDTLINAGTKEVFDKYRELADGD